MKEFGFEEIENIDLDGFFEESNIEKGDKKEMIKCPHCNEVFEMKAEYKQ